MNLVIAAYWTEDEPDDATGKLADAADGLQIPSTGGVVALDVSNVNAELRNLLRRLNLEEAANA